MPDQESTVKIEEKELQPLSQSEVSKCKKYRCLWILLIGLGLIALIVTSLILIFREKSMELPDGTEYESIYIKKLDQELSSITKTIQNGSLLYYVRTREGYTEVTEQNLESSLSQIQDKKYQLYLSISDLIEYLCQKQGTDVSEVLDEFSDDPVAFSQKVVEKLKKNFKDKIVLIDKIEVTEMVDIEYDSEKESFSLEKLDDKQAQNDDEEETTTNQNKKCEETKVFDNLERTISKLVLNKVKIYNEEGKKIQETYKNEIQQTDDETKRNLMKGCYTLDPNTLRCNKDSLKTLIPNLPQKLPEDIIQEEVLSIIFKIKSKEES